MLGSGISEESFVIEVFFNSCILVGQNLPYFGANYVQSHSGFKVWLIELSENSIGIIRFELGVKILFFININEAAASTSIIVVLVAVLNGNMIFTFLEI